MPILSAVVTQLNQLTGDDDAEVNQLAEVILKDPHMTSQILKVANSVQYNPINSSISTVSRAIVLLGFRGVRSLCISLMVVEFWTYGGQTADDLEMAESDCKAIEKTIGLSFNKLSKELGKVWCLGDTLQEALTTGSKKSEKAQAVLLGDAFSQSDLNDKNIQKELMKKMACFTGQSLADTQQLINERCS